MQVVGATREVIKHRKEDFKVRVGKVKPFAFGDTTHKVPCRGKRKKCNMVTMPRKGIFADHKYAKAKLISTSVGTGVAARMPLEANTKVTVYGGVKIDTKHDLGTAWGQRLAGIKDTSYVMKAGTATGGHVWYDGGTEYEAKKGRLGCFINDPRGRMDPSGTPLEANVIFREDSNGLPAVYTLKPVDRNEELLADYGWSDSVWEANLAKEKRQKTK
jgi:hypothetical protein